MAKSDALIIGAGLGGISAAISLAAKGWNVTLAEKNHIIGGKLNIHQQDGFSFDLGPSLLTMPHVFRALFSKTGKKLEDFIELTPIALQWRNFFEDKVTIDIEDSVTKTAEHLKDLSPGTDIRFLEFCSYADRQRKLAEEIYFNRGVDSVWDIIFGTSPLEIRKMDFFGTVSSSVRKMIQEPHTREIMSYFTKYVGSSPDKAPGFLNLLPSVQFAYGVYHVRGGMYSLAKGLGRLLEELDVRVLTDHEAVNLVPGKKGSIRGVRFRNGKEIPCDLLVSDMEAVPFYSRVAGLPDVSRSLEKWFPPSCSGLVIHLGVDRTYPDLGHHNIFHSATPHEQYRSVFERMTLPDDPTLYVVRPTRTDPALAPEGCDIIKVLPQIPHLHTLRKFTPSDMAPLRDRVLAKLERMGFDGLKNHIISEKTLTPYDLRNMYYSDRGSIYGTVSDRLKNMALKAPQKSRHFSNLYFVGGSVNPGGGMPMVIMSGMQVANRIGKPS
ncbi:MAG: phytoene desaturase family protein [Chitinispirillaceae bacterium]